MPHVSPIIEVKLLVHFWITSVYLSQLYGYFFGLLIFEIYHLLVVIFQLSSNLMVRRIPYAC